MSAMNYDERRRIAYAWLTDERASIGRRSAPKRLDTKGKVAGELDALTKVIVRTMPVELTQDAFRNVLDDVGDWLDRELRTTSWPTVPELTDAVRAVAPRMSAPKAPAQGRSASVDHTMDADELREIRWRANVPETIIDKETGELVPNPDYRPATLSDAQNQAALKGRMGMAEWRGHVAIVARLKGVTFEEAEAYELGGMREVDQIPAELLGQREALMRARQEVKEASRVADPPEEPSRVSEADGPHSEAPLPPEHRPATDADRAPPPGEWKKPEIAPSLRRHKWFQNGSGGGGGSGTGGNVSH